MAIVGIGKVKLLKRSTTSISLKICHFSDEASVRQWKMRKMLYTACGLAIGGTGAILYTLEQSVKAYEWPVHPPKYPWAHKGIISSYDTASIRRGFQVYKNVCSACHSLEFVPFRRLIDVAYTEDEMKVIAEEYEIEDGPNDEGQMFMRPGKVTDYLPKPYPNDDAAAFANNGAAPPDLSLIVLGREGGEDYIFSLLTGYCEPEEEPAGVNIPENGHYNPYFQGSVIAMAPPLYDGIIEYEDGTPATRSQLAKDVVNFLTWCGSPEQDKRRLWTIKLNMYAALILPLFWYINRHKWLSLKTRVTLFNDLKKRGL